MIKALIVIFNVIYFCKNISKKVTIENLVSQISYSLYFLHANMMKI